MSVTRGRCAVDIVAALPDPCSTAQVAAIQRLIEGILREAVREEREACGALAEGYAAGDVAAMIRTRGDGE